MLLDKLPTPGPSEALQIVLLLTLTGSKFSSSQEVLQMRQKQTYQVTTVFLFYSLFPGVRAQDPATDVRPLTARPLRQNFLPWPTEGLAGREGAHMGLSWVLGLVSQVRSSSLVFSPTPPRGHYKPIHTTPHGE